MGKKDDKRKKRRLQTKRQARRLVCAAVLLAVALFVLMSGFMVLRPVIYLGRADLLSDAGQTDEALKVISQAEELGADIQAADKSRLRVARKLLDSKEYREARTLAGELSVEGAAEVITHADYCLAVEEMEGGGFTSAAREFSRLGGYLDSADRYMLCLVINALNEYETGDRKTAMEMLLGIESSEDYIDRAAAFINKTDMLTENELSRESIIRQRRIRTELAEGAEDRGYVAAGLYHSLMVRMDGTVLSCGDNSKGQTNTGNWTNITMVAAGYYHSAGLREDGTVVAVGDNSAGQLNVKGWKDVVRIVCAAYDTVGLTSDGKVLIAGKNASESGKFKGMSLIAGGGYSVAASGAGGQVVSTHKGVTNTSQVAVYRQISCFDSVFAGVTTQGKAVIGLNDPPVWNDAVFIQAGRTGLAALDGEGRILTYFYRPSFEMNVEQDVQAAQIALGARHLVALMRDGSVRAWGSNDHGQLNVEGWER
ncbi:MAG: hypothetical protein K5663_09700 [Clostridiales bacterium]|nr:hypothetical protein [Clostridiales bacterium]